MENKIKTIEKIISLGLWGSLRLVRDLIISACIINIGSLIRYPFYIRKVGSLKILRAEGGEEGEKKTG